MAFWDVKVKEKNDENEVIKPTPQNTEKKTELKSKRVKCKILHASLNKDRIDVLLQFSNKKIAMAHIKPEGFIDNIEWLENTNEESYADVMVSLVKVNSVSIKTYTTYNPANADSGHITVNKEEHLLDFPYNEIKFTIIKLFLNKNAF